jgi:solute carrier family 25 oxoglutarate transporter 11
MSDFYKNFLVGTMSTCSATCCIQPMDMIKVRIQLKSEAGGNTGFLSTAKEIHGIGGVKEFYKGLDSAILRQVVYGTLRIGIYFNLTEWVKVNRNNGESLNPLQRAGCSMTAGALGSFVGNPADLCLVRMQADTTLPEAERRNYKNVFDSLSEEGVTALWRGSVPTMSRAIALNTCMLVSYDTAKEAATKALGPDASPLKIQFGSSMLAAVATAVGSLPFDNMKTKLQKQKAGPDGIMPYKGMPDCFAKSLAREGVTGFWAGLPTYYFRVGPHAIITLLAAEQYKRLLGVGQK